MNKNQKAKIVAFGIIVSLLSFTGGMIWQSWASNGVTDIEKSNLVFSGDTFPSSPANGQPFVLAPDYDLYIYNGTGWEKGGQGEQGPPGPAGSASHIPYAFIIFKSGTSSTYTSAMNCKTGQIDYNVTNAITVIQNSIDAAATVGGGSIFVKKATYDIAGQINLKTNVYLLLEAGTLLQETSSSYVVWVDGRNNGVNHCGIIGVGGYAIIDSSGGYCIRNNAANWTVWKNLELRNGGYDGLWYDVFVGTGLEGYCDYNIAQNLYIHSFSQEGAGFGFNAAGSHNFFDNILIDGQGKTTREGMLMASAGSKCIHNRISNLYSRNCTRNGLYIYRGTYDCGWVVVSNYVSVGNGFDGWDGLKLRAVHDVVADFTSSDDYSGFKFNTAYIESELVNWTYNNVVRGSITGAKQYAAIVDCESPGQHVVNNIVELAIYGEGYTKMGLLLYMTSSDCVVRGNTFNLNIQNISRQGVSLDNSNEATNKIEANVFNIIMDETSGDSSSGYGIDFVYPSSVITDNIFDVQLYNCPQGGIHNAVPGNIWADTCVIDGAPFTGGTLFTNIDNGTYIPHGLADEPDYVTITLSHKGYAWYGTKNSTHIQVYGANATLSGTLWGKYAP